MKIVEMDKIELVRKNFILNIFNETIAFKLPYTIENDIKKEYGFSINKEGKVALCDDLSSNNLDFNLEINKILTIVKTFEEVYGKIVFDKLTNIEYKYNKIALEECRRFEIEYTGYLEEDIRVLKLQRARFNRARKKKELDRLIKEKEMLLNDINAMNEHKIQKRSRIKNEYSKEMFEEANKFLNDINDKLFS